MGQSYIETSKPNVENTETQNIDKGENADSSQNPYLEKMEQQDIEATNQQSQEQVQEATRQNQILMEMNRQNEMEQKETVDVETTESGDKSILEKMQEEDSEYVDEGSQDSAPEADAETNEENVEGDVEADAETDEEEVEGDTETDEETDAEDVEGDAESDAETDAEDVEGDVEADAETEEDVEGDAETDTETDAEDVEGDAESDAETDAEDVEGNAETDAETDAEDVEGDAETDTETDEEDIEDDAETDEEDVEDDTETDTEDAEGDAETDAETDAEDVEGETDAETDAEDVEGDAETDTETDEEDIEDDAETDTETDEEDIEDDPETDEEDVEDDTETDEEDVEGDAETDTETNEEDVESDAETDEEDVEDDTETDAEEVEGDAETDVETDEEDVEGETDAETDAEDVEGDAETDTETDEEDVEDDTETDTETDTEDVEGDAETDTETDEEDVEDDTETDEEDVESDAEATQGETSSGELKTGNFENSEEKKQDVEERKTEEELIAEGKENLKNEYDYEAVLVDSLVFENQEQITLEECQNNQENINEALDTCEQKLEELDLKLAELQEGDPQYNVLMAEKLAAEEYRNALDLEKSVAEKTENFVKQEIMNQAEQTQEDMIKMAETADNLHKENVEKISDEKMSDADKKEIVENNNNTLNELQEQKNLLGSAVNLKFQEIHAYVTENNMDRYETYVDPEYRRMIASYKRLLETQQSMEKSMRNLESENTILGVRVGEHSSKHLSVNNPSNVIHKMKEEKYHNNMEHVKKDEISAEKMQEIKESVDEKAEFITNDGEKITFQEGTNRILRKAELYMDEIGVSDEDKKIALENLENTIYEQQHASSQRALGDHGIKHIYGNFERSDHFVKNEDPQTKLAVLIAQAHHDEGYMDSEIHKPGTFGKDGTHGMISAAYFKNTHREVYSKCFTDQSKLDSIEKAMATHNDKFNEKEGKVEGASLQKGDLVDNLKPEKDIIVSALHLSDKMALSEREKLPLVLSNNKELLKTTREIQLSQELAKKAGLSEKELDSMTKEYEDIYREKIQKHIQESDLPDEMKEEYLVATKDINFGSGKFNLPMNVVATSSESMRLKEVNGKVIASMDIQLMDTESAKLVIGEEQYGRQVKKAFEDMQVPDNLASRYAQEVMNSKDSVYTVELPGGNELNFYKQDVVPEDMKESRKYIEAANKSYSESEFVRCSETIDKVHELAKCENINEGQEIYRYGKDLMRYFRMTGDLESAKEIRSIYEAYDKQIDKLESASYVNEKVKDKQYDKVRQQLAISLSEYLNKKGELKKKNYEEYMRQVISNL